MGALSKYSKANTQPRHKNTPPHSPPPRHHTTTSKELSRSRFLRMVRTRVHLDMRRAFNRRNSKLVARGVDPRTIAADYQVRKVIFQLCNQCRPRAADKRETTGDSVASVASVASVGRPRILLSRNRYGTRHGMATHRYPIGPMYPAQMILPANNIVPQKTYNHSGL